MLWIGSRSRGDLFLLVCFHQLPVLELRLALTK
jgi:hypothetical protein